MAKIDKNWSVLPNKERFEKLRLVNYEWPVCSPLTGKVEKQYDLPYKGRPQRAKYKFKDSFNKAKLNLNWNFRRVPLKGTYTIDSEHGFLRLYSSSNIIENRKRCSLMGIRQKNSDFTFLAKMKFVPNIDGIDAGISLFQKDGDLKSGLLTVKNTVGSCFTLSRERGVRGTIISLKMKSSMFNLAAYL